MPFGDLYGNERIARALSKAVVRATVGSAYLFTGPKGIGKLTFAMELARALMCKAGIQGDSCGVCRPCETIARQEHPDLLVVEPEPTAIKIERIRELVTTVTYPPLTAPQRVIVIRQAHLMTVEAANSLLKTLEEPPSHSIFVLTSEAPDRLLTTIRSRTQAFSFAPLGHELITRFLVEKGGASPAEAERLSTRVHGVPGEALARVAAVDQGPTARDAIIALMERLPGMATSDLFLAVDELLEQDGPSQEETFQLAREHFVAMIRDQGADGPDRRALASLERIGEAEAAFRRNVNRRLVFEWLLLHLMFAFKERRR